jgi:actin-related protein
MAGAVEGDTFIGKTAQELRGLLKIRYPMSKGMVENWEDMERIWQYMYSEELKILSEEVKQVRLYYILYSNIYPAPSIVDRGPP